MVVMTEGCAQPCALAIGRQGQALGAGPPRFDTHSFVMGGNGLVGRSLAIVNQDCVRQKRTQFFISVDVAVARSRLKRAKTRD